MYNMINISIKHTWHELQGLVFEGGGEKKGNIVGKVIGIVVGMFGSGGRLNCGIDGIVGIVLGIDGWVGFGNAAGIVGKGGNVGFGSVGVVGFVVWRRLRAARVMSMFEKEIAMKIAKMKEL